MARGGFFNAAYDAAEVIMSAHEANKAKQKARQEQVAKHREHAKKQAQKPKGLFF